MSVLTIMAAVITPVTMPSDHILALAEMDINCLMTSTNVKVV